MIKCVKYIVQPFEDDENGHILATMLCSALHYPVQAVQAYIEYQ